MYSSVIPKDVQDYLDHASRHDLRTASIVPRFACQIFNSSWDQFVELWAPRVYQFVEHALGPYATPPLPLILKMPDGQHSAGATASFAPATGQVRLASSVEGKAGQTLEKLCHEFIHGALAAFPDGDPFYEEAQVDLATWVCAHAPTWKPYSEEMISAAAFNIANRRDRALRSASDYDAKRYAGGIYAMLKYGPHIVSELRLKKAENNLRW